MVKFKSPHFLLYIPHGSDNTLAYQALEIWIYNFISHMVQIIPDFYTDTIILLIALLYIPHGSDNTTKLMVQRTD